MLSLDENRVATSQSNMEESKSFKPLAKLLGVVGNWREWSFNFFTTLEGVTGPTAKALTKGVVNTARYR